MKISLVNYDRIYQMYKIVDLDQYGNGTMKVMLERYSTVKCISTLANVSQFRELATLTRMGIARKRKLMKMSSSQHLACLKELLLLENQNTLALSYLIWESWLSTLMGQMGIKTISMLWL